MRHQYHSEPSCPLQNCDTKFWISPLWAGGRPTPRNVLLISDALSPACSSNPAGLVGKPTSLIASASSPTLLLPAETLSLGPMPTSLLQDAAGPSGCSDTVYSSSGNFAKSSSLRIRTRLYPAMLCICLFLVFLAGALIFGLPHLPVQSS